MCCRPGAVGGSRLCQQAGMHSAFVAKVSATSCDTPAQQTPPSALSPLTRRQVRCAPALKPRPRTQLSCRSGGAATMNWVGWQAKARAHLCTQVHSRAALRSQGVQHEEQGAEQHVDGISGKTAQVDDQGEEQCRAAIEEPALPGGWVRGGPGAGWRLSGALRRRRRRCWRLAGHRQQRCSLAAQVGLAQRVAGCAREEEGAVRGGELGAALGWPRAQTRLACHMPAKPARRPGAARGPRKPRAATAAAMASACSLRAPKHDS